MVLVPDAVDAVTHTLLPHAGLNTSVAVGSNGAVFVGVPVVGIAAFAVAVVASEPNPKKTG